MFLFKMIFGVFRSIAGLFVRSRPMQEVAAFVLMGLTGLGLVTWFFIKNPANAPEPIARIIRQFPGLTDFEKKSRNTPAPDDNTQNPAPETTTSGNYAFENKPDFVLPHYKMPGQLIRHKGYALYYSDVYKQPVFVAYQLTAAMTKGKANRNNDVFHPDPLVETSRVTPDEYQGTGYDRGHLAPAADFKFSDEYMNDTFVMSNMSPQAPGCNREIWRICEEQTRAWARKYQAVYVISGAELKSGLPTIGRRHRIAVPERYFKVVLDLHPPQPKAIAFIIPNAATTQPLKSFVVSLAEVEKMTGLDLFPMLPPDLKTSLKAMPHPDDWTWQRGKKSNN